ILFDITNGTLKDPKTDPYITSKTNFGPRVAVTWSPDQAGAGFFSGGKSVFRGGFGIYYGPGQNEDQIQPIESDRISSTISSPTMFGGQQLLAFPAPLSAIVANFNANPTNRTFQPRAYANDYSIPEKVYQYSLSWQQQLPYNITSTIAYVGSQGRNLFLRSVANKILPGNTSVLNTATAFPTGVGVVNRTDPGTGQVTAVTTIRQFDILNNAAVCGASGTNPICRPFAEIDYKTSGGDDSYNALQVSAQRSYRTGLTMNVQYTFGKSVGTSAGSNEARTSADLDNFEADRGRNNFDIRHNFNLSALYELPFGKNGKYDFGKTGNILLGGWEVGGILNARSGIPVEILVVRPDVVVQCQTTGGCPNGAGGTFANGFTANLPSLGASFPQLPTGFVAVVNTPGGGNSRNIRRPDLIAGVNPFLNNDRQMINPAAFAIPTAGTFGNLKRNQFSGPSFSELDFTVVKRFRFTETTNFEFRTEVFNILNKTNFANPSTTLANALPSLSCTVVAGSCSTYSASNSNTEQPGQAFTQGAAGSTFGLLRATVNRTVGLGSNRQIQFGFRFNF
ncbi:MAG: hypothetical protein ACRD43_05880, partial [Pyrinomonadaceae bacterium]